MRTFIAVPLSESVKKTLRKLQVPADEIRWQSPEQMHITLKFLGEISADEVSRLQQSLAEVSKSPFSLKIQEVGLFPENSSPKVIWVGVSPTHEITQLYKAVESRCVSLGFEADDRPFLPHITLGRVKSKMSRKQIRDLLDEPEPIEFSVESFGIYKSELDPDGAIHTLIKKYPLPNQKK